MSVTGKLRLRFKEGHGKSFRFFKNGETERIKKDEVNGRIRRLCVVFCFW
jgi:hypothetical protein